MQSLHAARGGLPFFLAIFFNAFIDLGHKITIQNTLFKLHDGAEQVWLIAVVNALILLPYILLFAPIARGVSRRPKPHIMRFTAWVSLLLTLVLTMCYALGLFWQAFALTFLMAVQSAIYSPAKLSYLKILFGISALTRANGLAQAWVIAGILLGTVAFSLAFEALFTNALTSHGAVIAKMWPLGIALVLLALVQLWLVYRVPLLERDEQLMDAAQGTTAPWNARAIIGQVTATPAFWLPVFGLSLFWAIGQGMLATFPSYAKAYAGITNAAVIQGILAATSIGIAVGAQIAGLLSRGRVNLQLIPFGIVGLCCGLWSLEFWEKPLAFAVLYFLMGVSSALFLVPLNTYLQWQAGSQTLGSLIAASNLMQNIAMLVMLLLTIGFTLVNTDVEWLMAIIAILATVGGVVLVAGVAYLPRTRGGE